MSKINKAIPPTNIEFPDYVHQEYPKKLGTVEDGTMLVAENEEHEQQLRDDFPDETTAHDNKLLEDSEKPLKHHQELMKSKYRPGAPRPAHRPALASETHADTDAKETDDPFTKDAEDGKAGHKAKPHGKKK